MHASFKIDKSLSVSPGKRVIAHYEHVDNIILGLKKPMSIGDVQLKYELIKQNAPNQIFPCPVGHYREDGRFVIVDGRHTYIAAVMNGLEYILVAFIEEE